MKNVGKTFADMGQSSEFINVWECEICGACQTGYKKPSNCYHCRQIMENHIDEAFAGIL